VPKGVPAHTRDADLLEGRLDLLPDDAFLRFGGERIPGAKIVEIFLNDDIAAAGKVTVPVNDYYGVCCRLAPGILRPIDETHKISVVEVAEVNALRPPGKRHSRYAP
jgi:hypothetical protein